MSRVLHLLFSNDYGGAEKLVMTISQGLNQDFDFVYLSPAGPIQDELNKLGIEHLEFDPHNLFSLIHCVNEVKPDIIHAHDFKACVIANLFFKKIPVVSHIHQAPKWQMSNNFKSRLFKCVAKHSSKIVYVSEWARESYYFREAFNQSVVVENGIDFRGIQEMSNMFDTEPYDILFVGRLEEVKDPDRFIDIVNECIKKIPAIRVGIIGNGSLKKLISKKVSALPQIDYLGFKKNPYPYISNAKIVVSTSKEDAFGLTVVEAAILKAIPITPEIRGIGDIAHKVNGLTYQNNSQAVCFITDILLNRDYQNNVLENIQNSNLLFFDQKRYLDEIKKIYYEVLKLNE